MSGPGAVKARHLATLVPQLEVPDLAEGNFERMTASGVIARVTQMIGRDDTILVGSSFGGLCAAHVASACANVRGLLLLAPAFELATCWKQRDPDAIDAWRRTGAHEFGHGELPFSFFEDLEQRDAPPTIGCPTVVIHGRDDASVPYAISQRFADTNANVTLHLVDSDHKLHDQLDEIGAALSALIARVQTSSQ